MSELTTAELHLLKQITDSQERLTGALDEQRRLSAAIVERLVHVEARAENTATLESKIEGLRSEFTHRMNNHSDRLTGLEAVKNRIEGAKGLVDWLNKIWPLFAAGIGLIGIYLNYKR